MKNKAWVTILAMVAVCTLPALAAAQMMYRCGSTYQDRPCESGQGKAIGSVGSVNSAYKPVGNTECAQRGADSLKITWGREAGQTREKALAEADARPLSARQKQDTKKLITEVYNKRGSPLEIRAAIEADCVAEKEKEALAGRTSYPPETEPGPSVTGTGGKAANEPRRYDDTAGKADTRKIRCDKLKREFESIERKQRAGGSIETMEELRQALGDARRDLNESGC